MDGPERTGANETGEASVNAPMTVEETFVTLCACSQPDVQHRKRINEAALIPMDWEKVHDVAIRNRTIPLLYKNIKMKPARDSVPPDLFDKMTRIYAENSRRNFFLLSYLINLLDCFKSNGIFAVPFKGPVFTENIYGDLGLRFSSDLDILVQVKDARNAYKVLIEIGLTPEITLNNSQLQKYIVTEDNLSFFKNDPKVLIELHWELSGNYLSRPFILEDMLETLISVPIHNHEFPALPPEALLLYLCIHGAKHEWKTLDWVCCVAELLRKKKDLDWDLVEASAKNRKAQKMLHLGLELTWILFKSPIPANIIEKLEKNNPIIELSQSLITDMFSTHNDVAFKETRFSSFHFRVRDSLTDCLRYLSRLVFIPSKKEWSSLRLPASFSALYYIVRPFRLILTVLRP